MKNLETSARLTDLEEHSLILFAPIKGCAVEEPVVGLHQGTGGVVAVQERAGGLGEGKELGERSSRSQFEECAALGIGDIFFGNFRRTIKVPVRSLNDDIRTPALWTLVYTDDAAPTSESKELIDGFRALRAGGARQRQAENEDHDGTNAIVIE